MCVQDLADDVGMDLEELYMGYWEDSDSDCDSDTMKADSNLGICDPDDCQRGFVCHRSESQVWLTEHVPSKYLSGLPTSSSR
jgi:hypothetical protein